MAEPDKLQLNISKDKVLQQHYISIVVFSSCAEQLYKSSCLSVATVATVATVVTVVTVMTVMTVVLVVTVVIVMTAKTKARKIIFLTRKMFWNYFFMLFFL